MSRAKSVPNTLSDATWHKIAAEYTSGIGTTELAKRYGVGRSTVTARLRRLGIDLRMPGQYDTDDEKAPSLADDGLMWVRKGGILVGVPIPEHMKQPPLSQIRAKVSHTCRWRRCEETVSRERRKARLRFCSDACKTEAQRARDRVKADRRRRESEWRAA
jgi:hypothetical protein